MAELEVWGAEGAGVLQEIESWVRWSGRQGRVGKESPVQATQGRRQNRKGPQSCGGPECGRTSCCSEDSQPGASLAA